MLKSKTSILNLIFAAVILTAVTSYAAFDFIGLGAESISLGNAMVAYRAHSYAVYYNPAHISSAQKPAIEFGYRSFFGLSSPRQIYLLFNHSIRKIPFSCCCMYLGNPVYNEMQFAAGSSYTFQKKVAVGMSLNLYALNISGYASSVNAGVNLGFSYLLTDQFVMGVLITNLNQPKFSRCGEKVPQSFSLGWCYSPQENFALCYELYRDVKYETEYRAGVMIRIPPALAVRFGLEDKMNTCNLGLGITVHGIQFDYAVILHQVLGISHVTSMKVFL
jgi:hypothetical protein